MQVPPAPKGLLVHPGWKSRRAAYHGRRSACGLAVPVLSRACRWSQPWHLSTFILFTRVRVLGTSTGSESQCFFGIRLKGSEASSPEAIRITFSQAWHWGTPSQTCPLEGRVPQAVGSGTPSSVGAASLAFPVPLQPRVLSPATPRRLSSFLGTRLPNLLCWDSHGDLVAGWAGKAIVRVSALATTTLCFILVLFF